jgi:hypothetical protein
MSSGGVQHFQNAEGFGRSGKAELDKTPSFYPETRIPELFQAIFTYQKCLKPNKYERKQLFFW